MPYDIIELYKRENRILAYKRDIEEIVKWSVLYFCINFNYIFNDLINVFDF